MELLEEITPSGQYEKLFKAVVLDIWQKNYKKLDTENARIRKDITRLEEERQKIFTFHRTGKYNDDDFLEQKKIIDESIEQKYNLISDRRYEEFSMDEALENCFTYVRNTAREWVEADYQTKLRLQRLVFKSKVEYDGKSLGISELSHVYRINQLFVADKSTLVAPRGVEPLLTA